MVRGLQGEEWKFIQKYLKKRSHVELAKQRRFRTKDAWAGANFAQAEGVVRISHKPKAISSLFQLQIVHGLKRWILDFLSFEMVYSMYKMDFWKCSKSAKEDYRCCLLFSSLCFPLLHCSFLAYFERLWQKAMELQSLVLHEFELPKALP